VRIAVIPARGGSKRIPRKNIMPFYGKPMIAWSIEAAQAAKIFDRIIVSTDDAEITQVAQSWGAEVPFVRPRSLSDDFATTNDVMAHATKWAIDEGLAVSQVCCIYATAPFVSSKDILNGLSTLAGGPWEYVFSATEFSSPIQRSFMSLDGGGVEMFFPEQYTTRSQDLPVALHDAAQFYWGKASAWLESRKIFDFQSTTIRIPRWRVQDIDTIDDWSRAEIMAPMILDAV